MIGTLPMKELAPLNYRYALDASRSFLGKRVPFVQCHVPELLAEVHQRFPRTTEACTDEGRVVPTSLSAALWVEPLQESWRDDLEKLTTVLSEEALLLIIASRPLARLLPERLRWRGSPVGVQLGGVNKLCHALREADFKLMASYGVHSIQAIALNTLSQQVARWGNPTLGDRLHFAARLRYCTDGPFAALSTVALLVARKERHG